MRSAGGSDTSRESIERRLAALVARQHGTFTRDQAARMGVSKSMIQRRLADGRWERLHPAVFRVSGTPPSWHQALLAACFACGEGAVASHRAAAALWRMPGFGAGPVEVTVPRGRRPRPRGVIVHSLPQLTPADVTTVGAIRVTAVARTLIDVASVATLDEVEEALDDVLRRNLVSLPRLRWRVGELSRRGRPGVGVMRALLTTRERAAPVPQSVFETRLLRVLRGAGLPEAIPQHRIRSRGRLVAVVDFAFPAERLAVEADGYRWHSGRARWEHDRARRNELTLLGWGVIHVTWNDLSRKPRAVIESVRAALEKGS